MTHYSIRRKPANYPFLTMLSVAVAAGLMALVGQVHAANTGTVTVDGRIEAGTCDLDAGDVTKNVILDPIKVADLPAGGAAGAKRFQLTVNNCDAGLTSADFTFTTGAPDATDSLRYKNTGTAKGVAVDLASTDGRTIGANGTDNVRTAQIAGGQAVLEVDASYWRLPGVAVEPGSVTAMATVNTSYD